MNTKEKNIPKVYFTKNISPEYLIKLYDILNKPLTGKVALKFHSGEHDKPYIIGPEFMKNLVNKLNATLIESNTWGPGKRTNKEDHMKMIEKHGFTKLFNVDIIDGDDEIEIPLNEGKRIKKAFLGKNIEKYNSILVLSHFKGHKMGGYGGALKNLSIGISSRHGKGIIHGAGDVDKFWTQEQDLFLESMVDAAKGIIDYMKGNIVYINVMKDMSVDCDCDGDPKEPEMKDIGMLSSIDPVALDQACIDLLYNSNDKGKEGLIKRIAEKHGLHTIEVAEKEGIGSRKYELVNIDNS